MGLDKAVIMFIFKEYFLPSFFIIVFYMTFYATA